MNITKDMSILLFNGFLLLGFVVAVDVLPPDMRGVLQIVDRNPVLIKKCTYSKVYSMLEAQCSKMELDNIPFNLNKDVQVLDITVNRLRDLRNDTLAPFKSLVYLYLGDNFIQNIEEAAFRNQHYLEVLDLSKNGCDEVPKSLFQLPHLRTLYLGNNKLTDSVFKMEVNSPLKMLQLTKNKLTKIPNIGFIPTLQTLNLSDNVITTVSTEDLAPFCSLKALDLSRNPIRFNDGNCECQTMTAWLKERKINVNSDFVKCAATNDCAIINVQFSNRTYELYNTCSVIIQQKVETEKARSVWILVVSCVSVFLFVVFVALFCVHKRNRRRRKKQKEQQQLAANNANTELLNSNLTVGNS
ncbi:biglycan isoform X2 [Linepithema humile]|uniref:biglycan isoform X2 n=1 Tax=Linepithema humile TaxID=83485 RepID=UPI00351DC831